MVVSPNLKIRKETKCLIYHFLVNTLQKVA